MALQIVTYNCRGLGLQSKGVVNKLCSENDIVLLQETWLYNDNLNVLNSLHHNFNGFGISSMNSTDRLISGRPHGGIAFLWKNVLSHCVEIVKYNNPRILGLQVSGANDNVLILNVYMPYDCTYNYDEYINLLADVNAIVQNANTCSVLVVGDFNADFRKPFGEELITFAQENSLIISDKVLLGSAYTYVSESHHTTSWLDHCLSTHSAHCNIHDIKVLDHIAFSDHLPLSFKYLYSISLTKNNNNQSKNVTKCFTDWENASNESKCLYNNLTINGLANINVSKGVLCTDPNCSSVDHKYEIDTLYNNIKLALLNSSDNSIDKKEVGKFKCIPGWNDNVKDVHELARESYIIWRDNGKPKQGFIFDNMKVTRARFKYVLRQCKANEEMHRADSLAKSMQHKDYLEFWKGVNVINNKKVPLATTVGGATGENDIGDMWREHYSDIMNSSVSDKYKDIVNMYIANIDDCHMFTVNNIKIAISKLKQGKAVGMDGISSEHLIYADSRLHVLLSLLFNAMLTHGYICDSLMDTIIVPIIKNKSGNIGDKNNYRPVALGTAISKLFELVLLDKIELYMYTTCNQFGFKDKHSTDLCLFTFRQIVEYYNSHSSPVFICFMDASKAFDKVHHWTLFKKLIDRKIPNVIVRLLVYWYSKQKYYIQWGKYMSPSFNAINGVKQGGILSPKLFNIYTNDLSNELLKSNIGCSLFGNVVNHLFYADDIVLICTSAKGLQKLVNICSTYAKTHFLKFNSDKTKCMAIVSCKTLKLISLPALYIDGTVIDYVNTHKYLGFIVSSQNDDQDILRQMKSYISKTNMLLRVFSKCSVDVKIMLFKTFCTNMYCIHLWSNFTSGNFNKFRVTYNNGFRKLLQLYPFCSASGMYSTNCVKSLPEVIRKTIYNFMNRLYISDNIIIRSLSNNPLHMIRSLQWKHWFKCLYTNVQF